MADRKRIETPDQKMRKADRQRARIAAMTPGQQARRVARQKELDTNRTLSPEQRIYKAEASKVYRATHKEEKAAYAKTYYAAHRVEALSWSKRYYEAHKDERKMQQQIYYEDPVNRERCRVRSKAYYQAHRTTEDLARIHARGKAYRNRLRAERRGCDIAPDVSVETYARIMANSPLCTYCPAQATAVDHVWPFNLMGAETDENLVPSCRTCNAGKKAKPLTEWEWGKVEYGVAHSTKVAAELTRLVMMTT